MRFTSDGGVDSYPLSPMQQGMLFHCLQGETLGVDVEQVICELHEEIGAAQLEQAWRELVARHVVLRTGFEWPEGEAPRQIVHRPAEIRVPFHCEEFGSEAEALHGLDEYLAADRRLGFPRLDAPLFRVALLRGSERHFWFVTTYHHLLLDARAMTVMFREVLDLHDAFARGRRLELPTPTPYRRYIDWLQTLDQAAAENFWRQHLEGFTTPSVLPLNPPVNPVEGETRGELMLQLPAATMTQLRAAAHAQNATLNAIVQAAWAVLLSRYTGEEDLVFGAVRACRRIPIPDADSIIGLFINTVPLRVRIDAETTVGALLQALRGQWQEFRRYEHTPLMKISQCSSVAPGRPLFDTFVSFQEPAWDASLHQLGGPWSDRQFYRRSQPNYALGVDAAGGTELTVKLVYDRRRFADDAIGRLLGHYRVLLEAIAANPDRKVAELPLLTNWECQQVLVGWNQTAKAYPCDRWVHALVEEHAAISPESLAVADARTSLSYGELNGRANQLAHRLRTLGVRAETLVAVGMDRSVEMLIAWLGILKAGGAFVPIDPTYPADRIAFQLEDCGAPILLTQPGCAAKWPRLASVQVIEVTADGKNFESEAGDNPPPNISSGNLAYVIYTSGSTGRPKGVPIEHRALMNLVAWHRDVYQLTSADRATHLASPAFDASVWEIWPYLASGASVHIPDNETRMAPGELVRWMARQAITLAFMPTPLAEAALSETWPRQMALRALLTGGDKLKRRPPDSVPCVLVNHYGPTENTVVSTCAVIRPDETIAAAPAIGRPIANTRAYVLDRQRQPVPIGVPGELYIGGDGLARGYLNRADLTAEKFISDPFARETMDHGPWTTDQRTSSLNSELQTPNSKLYRTGDIVRWTAEGELEFLGRIDTQVKIRGHRIEPGEIEAAIHAHPAVRESLVVARVGERADLQLVAYVLSRPEVAIADGEIVEFLRARLPAYMVPAAVVVLTAWPLTPNGKIDRQALPAPQSGSRNTDGDAAAPGGPCEELVARIYGEVLGRDAIGRNDNFFELGGHSLLAAQVVSRLNAAMPVALSVRALFDQPTVAGLAGEVERRMSDTAVLRTPAHRVRRRAPKPEMELVPPN